MKKPKHKWVSVDTKEICRYNKCIIRSTSYSWDFDDSNGMLKCKEPSTDNKQFYCTEQNCPRRKLYKDQP